EGGEERGAGGATRVARVRGQQRRFLPALHTHPTRQPTLDRGRGQALRRRLLDAEVIRQVGHRADPRGRQGDVEETLLGLGNGRRGLLVRLAPYAMGRVVKALEVRTPCHGRAAGEEQVLEGEFGVAE